MTPALPEYWLDTSGRWSGGGTVVIRNLLMASRLYPEVLAETRVDGAVRLVPRNVPARRSDLLGDFAWMPQNALPWGPVAPHERTQQRLLRYASALAARRARALVRISGVVPPLSRRPTSPVLHNVLDEEVEKPLAAAAKVEPGEHFYAAGSAHSYRRLPELVRGYALYRAGGGTADLRIQVSPGSPGSLKELMSAADGVPGVTISQGTEDRAGVLAAMAGSRGVIFPSSVEASPVTLLEALALGRPVACSRIVAHAELLASRDFPRFDLGVVEETSEALGMLESCPAETTDPLRDAGYRERERERWARRLATFLELLL